MMKRSHRAAGLAAAAVALLAGSGAALASTHDKPDPAPATGITADDPRGAELRGLSDDADRLADEAEALREDLEDRDQDGDLDGDRDTSTRRGDDDATGGIEAGDDRRAGSAPATPAPPTHTSTGASGASSSAAGEEHEVEDHQDEDDTGTSDDGTSGEDDGGEAGDD